MAAGCSAPCATYIKPSDPKKSSSLPEAPRATPDSRRHSCPLPEAPPCLETRPYKACPSGGAAGKPRKSEGGDSGVGGGGSKGHADSKPMAQKLLGILYKIREPLAEHQATQGLPKEEQYTFVELVRNLCAHSYQAVLAILTMLYSLIPFLDGFLYLVRFVLDKLIEICRCETKFDLFFVSVSFLLEMIMVVIFLIIATTFVMLPVWNLAFCFLGRLIPW